MNKFILSLVAAVFSFGLFTAVASADYRIGFVFYVVNGYESWEAPARADADNPTPDELVAESRVAEAKAAAAAVVEDTLDECQSHTFDQNGDGSGQIVTCFGDGQHIYYDGGSRNNHPGTVGNAWPSDTRDADRFWGVWQSCTGATYSQGEGTASADLFCAISLGLTGEGELRFVNAAARTAYHNR